MTLQLLFINTRPESTEHLPRLAITFPFVSSAKAPKLAWIVPKVTCQGNRPKPISKIPTRFRPWSNVELHLPRPVPSHPEDKSTMSLLASTPWCRRSWKVAEGHLIDKTKFETHLKFHQPKKWRAFFTANKPLPMTAGSSLYSASRYACGTFVMDNFSVATRSGSEANLRKKT